MSGGTPSINTAEAGRVAVMLMAGAYYGADIDELVTGLDDPLAAVAGLMGLTLGILRSIDDHAGPDAAGAMLRRVGASLGRVVP